jgi:ABC-type glutathione transport system ATPase component
MNNQHSNSSNNSILQVENLSKDYIGKGGVVHALKDISFTINPGEWVALRGPSALVKQP